MRLLPIHSDNTRPPIQEGGRRLSWALRPTPKLPEGHWPALAACSRRNNHTLTRGELAAIFSVSTKTISRWQERFVLPFEQRNARVIRYSLEAVVELVALDATLNRDEAERLGLDCDAIISLASTMVRRGKNPADLPLSMPPPTPVVLIAKDNDDRRLIALWTDATHGPVLRKILRGLDS